MDSAPSLTALRPQGPVAAIGSWTSPWKFRWCDKLLHPLSAFSKFPKFLRLPTLGLELDIQGTKQKAGAYLLLNSDRGPENSSRPVRKEKSSGSSRIRSRCVEFGDAIRRDLRVVSRAEIAHVRTPGGHCQGRGGAYRRRIAPRTRDRVAPEFCSQLAPWVTSSLSWRWGDLSRKRWKRPSSASFRSLSALVILWTPRSCAANLTHQPESKKDSRHGLHPEGKRLQIRACAFGPPRSHPLRRSPLAANLRM